MAPPAPMKQTRVVGLIVSVAGLKKYCRSFIFTSCFNIIQQRSH